MKTARKLLVTLLVLSLAVLLSLTMAFAADDDLNQASDLDNLDNYSADIDLGAAGGADEDELSGGNIDVPVLSAEQGEGGQVPEGPSGGEEPELPVPTDPVVQEPLRVLSAEGGRDSIVIQWAEVEGAAGYDILWADPNHGKYYELATIDDPSVVTYTHTSLALDQANSYKVVPFTLSEEGVKESLPAIRTPGDEDFVTAYTDCGVPSFTITSLASNVFKLTIKESPSVLGYNVYRAESADGPFVLWDHLDFPSMTERIDKEIVVGNTYYYKVSAINLNDGQETATSAVVSKKATFVATKLVSVENVNLRDTKITWEIADALGSDDYVFEVYRSLYSNKSFTKIAIVDSDEREYIDTGAVYGKTYYYKVRAVKGSTVSSYTSVMKVKKPTIATPKIDEYIPIIPIGTAYRFNHVEHADGYEVWRSTSSSSGFKMISDDRVSVNVGDMVVGIDASTSYGKTYYYKVRAYNFDDFGKKVYSGYTKTFKIATGLPAPKYEIAIYDDAVWEENYVKHMGEIEICCREDIFDIVLDSSAIDIEVYRSTDKKTWKKLVDGKGYEHYKGIGGLDMRVTPGKTYYYKARYVYDNGTTKYTSPYSAVKTVKATIPVDQINVEVMPDMSGIKISPTNLFDENKYWLDSSRNYTWVVLRSSKSAKSGFELISWVSIGSISADGYWVDTDVVPGKTYYYKVQLQSETKSSIFDRKDSDWAEYGWTKVKSVKFVPKAPTNAKAQDANVDGILVKWDSATTCEAEYEVYRSTSKSSGYTKIATVSSLDGCTYLDTKVSANKTYYYKVLTKTEVNGKAVKSAYSSVASAKVAYAAAGLSLSKSETMGDAPAVALTWKNLEYADTYEILRSTSATTGFKSVAIVEAIDYEINDTILYEDTAVSVGKTYYYKVVAKATSGNIKANISTSAKKIAFTQAKPTLKVTNADNHIYIVGKGDVFVDGYEVHFSVNGKTFSLESTFQVSMEDDEVLAEDFIVAQGKTIYVKIRTFVIEAGKKIYSAFSSVVKGKAF